MERLTLTTAQAAVLDRLAARYLWWGPVEGHPHSAERQIAQIMHLGTYADIRRLEDLVGERALGVVMQDSQPGWFDDRSWSFWRGRLLASGETGVQEHRPLRSFAHAEML